jgi:hypothetical protein
LGRKVSHHTGDEKLSAMSQIEALILIANTGDEKLSAMSQIEALILIANTGDEKLVDVLEFKNLSGIFIQGSNPNSIFGSESFSSPVLDRRYEPIVFLRPILSECVYSFTC